MQRQEAWLPQEGRRVRQAKENLSCVARERGWARVSLCTCRGRGSEQGASTPVCAPLGTPKGSTDSQSGSEW